MLPEELCPEQQTLSTKTCMQGLSPRPVDTLCCNMQLVHTACDIWRENESRVSCEMTTSLSLPLLCPLSSHLLSPPPPLCCKILLWVFYFMPYHATHDGAFPVFIRQHKHGSTDHKAGPEKITTWAETQAWQRRLRCAGTGFKDRGGSVGCREYSHHNLSLTWSSPCNACSPKYF